MKKASIESCWGFYLPTKTAIASLYFLIAFLMISHFGYGNNYTSKKLQSIKESRRVEIIGTVVDINGEPIPGVTISVPGTGRGTATDLDGKYMVNVDKGETLVFSFIGFVSQIWFPV